MENTDVQMKYDEVVTLHNFISSIPKHYSDNKVRLDVSALMFLQRNKQILKPCFETITTVIKELQNNLQLNLSKLETTTVQVIENQKKQEEDKYREEVSKVLMDTCYVQLEQMTEDNFKKQLKEITTMPNVFVFLDFLVKQEINV